MIDETPVLALIEKLRRHIIKVQEHTKDRQARMQCTSHVTMLDQILEEIHASQVGGRQSGKTE